MLPAWGVGGEGLELAGRAVEPAEADSVVRARAGAAGPRPRARLDSWETGVELDWDGPKAVGGCRLVDRSRSQVEIVVAASAGGTHTFHSRMSPAGYAAGI